MRHMYVPVCPYRQDCSGVGFWGTRVSQPAFCVSLYQQQSWAETSDIIPSQREEQGEAFGVSALISVTSGICMWCVPLPAGSRFSALLLVGPGHGAVAAPPLSCQIQHDMSSCLLLTEWSIITSIG